MSDTAEKRAVLTFTVPADFVKGCFIAKAEKMDSRAKMLEESADRLAESIKAAPEDAAGYSDDAEEDGGGRLLAQAALGVSTLVHRERVRMTPKALRAQATDLRRAAECERRLADLVSEGPFTLYEQEVRTLLSR